MLEQGITLFSQNRYEEAQSFFESLVPKQLSFDEAVSYYHYLLAIYRSTASVQKYHCCTLDYFSYLNDNTDFKLLSSSLLEYCKNDLSIDLSSLDEMAQLDSKLLQFGWKSSIEVGQVQLARSFSQCLLNCYNQSHNFAAMRSHLDERSKRLSSELSIVRWNLLGYLYCGSVVAFDQLLKDTIKRGERGIDEWLLSLYRELRNLECYTATLNESLEFSLLELRYMELDDSLSLRKSTVNLLYRTLLSDYNDHRVIKEIFTYGLFVKSRRICEQAKQIVVTNPSFFSRPKSVKILFDSLIDDTDNLEACVDEELDVDDSFDFATDLFTMNGLHSSADGRDERGFEFLKSIGADELAQGVRKQLIERQERESDSSPNSANSMQRGGESITQNLIYNLDYFSKLYCSDSEREKVDNPDDKLIATYLSHDGISDLESSYSDLAVALIEMKLHSSALVVLEKAENSTAYREVLERRIEHSYLKVEVLRALKRYGDAVALIEEMLTTWALVKDEVLCFNYIAAELYQEMDDRGRALNHYLAVSSIDSSYRLVQQRLKDFE